MRILKMTSEKEISAKKTEEESSSFIFGASLKDYLENAPESKCDLVDGQYFHHSPSSLKHNRLRRFLEIILETYVREYDLGVIISENIPVKLDERNWREPDIAFISKARMGELHEFIYTGAPDFIIEILSEDSRLRDIVRKRAEYEQIRVNEYWIIDPLSYSNSLFLRLEDTKYQEIKFETKKLEPACISGFFFLKEWIWPKTDYPEFHTVFRALGLLDFWLSKE